MPILSFPPRTIAAIAGVRTPFAPAGGPLRSLPARELGRLAISELLLRGDFDPGRVDQVVIGSVAHPPDTPNLARAIALAAGLPRGVAASTVHRDSATGCEAVAAGARLLAMGEAEVVVVGGVESMSRAPFCLPPAFTEKVGALTRARTFRERARALTRFRPGDLRPRRELGPHPRGCRGRPCPGEVAEALARRLHLTRQEQDGFAAESHRRAVRGWQEGHLGEEVVPVYVPPDYGPVVEDVGPGGETSLESLGRLRPLFDGGCGTVTAGNSGRASDGAAALLLATAAVAGQEGWTPLGYLRSYAVVGLDPGCLGPALAIPLALRGAGANLREIGLVEVNEAFAAEVLAVERAFLSSPLGPLDRERLNVNGGAIALGHPVGATGARLILTLLKEMRRRGVGLGLIGLGLEGGHGAAMAWELA